MTHPPSDCYDAALCQLPDAYALALRLRGVGASDAELCRALQVEPEGLDTLMTVAAEKLAAALEAVVRFD